MSWYLRACPTCGGDMHDGLEEERQVRLTTCFMCGRNRVQQDHAPEYLRLPHDQLFVAPETVPPPSPIRRLR